MLVPVLLALAGCGLFGDDEEQPPLESLAPATTTTTIPPTTAAAVDPLLVQDCVEYIQFQAFVGDELWSAIWDGAGNDVTRLRQTCIDIGLDNPTGLADLSREWQRIKGGGPDFEAPPSTT